MIEPDIRIANINRFDFILTILFFNFTYFYFYGFFTVLLF